MTNKDKKEECVFCDRDVIQGIISENEDIYLVRPLNPVVEGHRIIIPKKHVSDFTEDTELFGQVARVTAEIAKQNGGDYNLIVSKGRCATQTVFHLHIHLVPREEGDGLALPWTNQNL